VNEPPKFQYGVLLRDSIARRGVVRTVAALLKGAFEIARDYWPSRRRMRFGDMDFDWDHRVDTTWANLPLATRIREVLAGRPYQPSDPLTFHEMMSQLAIDLRDFTFVDLGAGKGRALLMASDYPFRKIIGVELLPELEAIAQQNVRKYSSDRQQCRNFEVHCGDARLFQLPPEPLVIFLFDPFAEDILRRVIEGIAQSVREAPRKVYVAYQNPVSEGVLKEFPSVRKIAGTIAYAIYQVCDRPLTTGH
jgi:SAM-dependent methyltransferase